MQARENRIYCQSQLKLYELFNKCYPNNYKGCNPITIINSTTSITITMITVTIATLLKAHSVSLS